MFFYHLSEIRQPNILICFRFPEIVSDLSHLDGTLHKRVMRMRKRLIFHFVVIG